MALPPSRLSTLPVALLQVRDAATSELLQETRLCAEGALADAVTIFVRDRAPPAAERQDQRCAFELDTLGAGSRPLLITVHSPMSAGSLLLHYRELAGGLRFAFTPRLPGVYRFGGHHHVLGSPFEIHVAGTRTRTRHTVLARRYALLSPLHSSSSLHFSTTSTVRNGECNCPIFESLNHKFGDKNLLNSVRRGL